MRLYFSSKSASDKIMMDEIVNIHNTAIANFQLNYITAEQLTAMKNFPVEVILNPRLKTRGGTAKFNKLTRKLVIEINYLLHKENMGELKNTYLHELGHILDYYFFNSSSRGSGWTAITVALGGCAERTHKMDTSAFKNKRTRYNYSCGCQIHTITAARHNKILRGYTYKCTKCKGQIKPLSAELKKFVPEQSGIIG